MIKSPALGLRWYYFKPRPSSPNVCTALHCAGIPYQARTWNLGTKPWGRSKEQRPPEGAGPPAVSSSLFGGFLYHKCCVLSSAAPTELAAPPDRQGPSGPSSQNLFTHHESLLEGAKEPPLVWSGANSRAACEQRHHFANKGPSSQSYGFSSSLVRMWELDHKEGWVPKNWCFPAACWRRLLRVPWMARRSRTDAEAEAPILQPSDVKSWLVRKDPDTWKDWGQEENGTTEVVGWHHWLKGHEFEQTLGKIAKDKEAWRAGIHGVAKSWT